MAFIYIIRNRVNDKVYIGKTEFSVEKRFAEHCKDYLKRDCEKRPLYDAMKKHGIENFYVEVIEETNNAEERERFWISHFGSYKHGYNATIGGEGKPYIDYDEVVEAYSRIQNCSKVAKELGICVDSVKDVLKVRGVDVIPPGEVSRRQCGKAVAMKDKDGSILDSFNSLTNAASFVAKRGNYANIDSIRKHISEVCRNKRHSAYGYLWAFN